MEIVKTCLECRKGFIDHSFPSRTPRLFCSHKCHLKCQAKSSIGRERIHREGYLEIKKGTPFLSKVSSRGWKPKFRLVAEQILGRPLMKGEKVAFLDGNKLNIDPRNLLITRKSYWLHRKSRSDFFPCLQCGKVAWRLTSKSRCVNCIKRMSAIPHETKRRKWCSGSCGKLVQGHSGRCRKCYFLIKFGLKPPCPKCGGGKTRKSEFCRTCHYTIRSASKLLKVTCPSCKGAKSTVRSILCRECSVKKRKLKKTCPTCGGRKSTGTAIQCQKCRHPHPKHRWSACEDCGDISYKPIQRICCQACRKERRKKKPKLCQYCERAFIPCHSFNKTCSRSCGNFNRKRRIRNEDLGKEPGTRTQTGGQGQDYALRAGRRLVQGIR